MAGPWCLIWFSVRDEVTTNPTFAIWGGLGDVLTSAHLGYAEGQVRHVQGTVSTREHNTCCMEAHYASWASP